MKKITTLHKILAVCGLLLLLVAAAMMKAKSFSGQAAADILAFLKSRPGCDAAAEKVDSGWAGVSLKNVAIKNQVNGQAIFTAEELSFSWSFLSFASGRAKLDEISLTAPRIILDKSAEKDEEAASAGEKIDASVLRDFFANSSRPGGAAILSFSQAGGRLAIENGALAIRENDAAAQPRDVLTAVSIKSDAFNPAAPSVFSAAAQFAPETSGLLRVTGEADLSSMVFNIETDAKKLDLAALVAFFSKDEHIDSGALTADFKAEINGSERIFLKGPYDVAELKFKGKQAAEPISVKGGMQVEINPAAGLFDFSETKLIFNEQEVELSGKLDLHGSPPSAVLSLKSPKLEIEKLGKLVSALPFGPRIERRVKFKSEPKSNSKSEPGDLAPMETGFENFPLPRRKSKPGSKNLTVDISVESLSFHGLTASDFSGKLSMAGGIADFVGKTQSQKDKRVKVNAIVDVKSQGMPYDAQVKADDFELADFFMEEDEPSKKITGSLSFLLENQGWLSTVDRNLVKIKASSRDGKVRNLHVLSELSETLKTIDSGVLRYSFLRCEAAIFDETANIQNFSLSAPGIQTSAMGSFGLADKALDMRVAAAIPEKVAVKVIKDKDLLEVASTVGGWTLIPLRLKGSFDRPKYVVDNDRLSAMAEPGGVDQDENIEPLDRDETGLP